MSGARTWCRSLAICAFVLGLAAIAAPSYAQTGQVKGKVVGRERQADRRRAWSRSKAAIGRPEVHRQDEQER